MLLINSCVFFEIFKSPTDLMDHLLVKGAEFFSSLLDMVLLSLWFVMDLWALWTIRGESKFGRITESRCRFDPLHAINLVSTNTVPHRIELFYPSIKRGEPQKKKSNDDQRLKGKWQQLSPDNEDSDSSITQVIFWKGIFFFFYIIWWRLYRGRIWICHMGTW